MKMKHGQRKLERVNLERRKDPVTGRWGVYPGFDPAQQPSLAQKLSSVGPIEKKLGGLGAVMQRLVTPVD